MMRKIADPQLALLRPTGATTRRVPYGAPKDEVVAAWPSEYASRLVEADSAVAAITSGQRVYIGGGCGEPVELVAALARQAERLRDVEIVHILTTGPAPYIEPGMEASFRVNALFIGGNVRQAVSEGRADFTPAQLSEIPRLFREGQLPLDVALVSVSPPDEYGYCSYGVEVGVTKPAAESARLVIAEINPNMPQTWGNSFIHVSRLNYCVVVDYPLLELHPAAPMPLYAQIGANVAALVPDGATLQAGIGAIPDAVLASLGDKSDLGVHSEMFSDGVLDLVERGVITGARKSLLPGKIVAGFALGTARLYSFLHENPSIELYPSDFVNDPGVISMNDRLVAINSALQIDLTGQVCADSIGQRIYSGVGGQADFIRGAAHSAGGVPIIALPSSARDGQLSRIVPTLDTGAGVTITRNEVRFVVTEYGVADLFGKSLRRRAEELIAIAHPDFRAELSAAARARRLL